MLERVAGRASSDLGRERVLELVPGAHVGPGASRAPEGGGNGPVPGSAQGLAPPEIPDARSALERLALEGSVLEPEELHSLGRF